MTADATSGQASATTEPESGRPSPLLEVVRAASGGLLFGIPLMYTMEMWWTGQRTQPAAALAVLAGTYLVLLVLNATNGFRSHRDTSLVDAAADAVVGLAVGLVCTFALLVLLREVTFEQPAQAVAGMVVYESIPFCLGVGLARHLLSGGRVTDDDDEEDASSDPQISATLADLGATAIGAAFIAVSIAPTDEVPMLTAQLGPLSVLALAAASLVITYAVVFVAEFGDRDERVTHAGVLQTPLAETIAAYLVSLLVALVLLLVFHRADVPWTELLDRVLVLGLPAALGGAAGRLAV